MPDPFLNRKAPAVLGSRLVWIENIVFSGAAQAHLCLLVWHVIIRSDATIVATAWTHLLTVSSNGVFNFNFLGGVPYWSMVCWALPPLLQWSLQRPRCRACGVAAHFCYLRPFISLILLSTRSMTKKRICVCVVQCLHPLQQNSWLLYALITKAFVFCYLRFCLR